MSTTVPPPISTRDRLHRLADILPEAELDTAARVVARRDAVIAPLGSAGADVLSALTTYAGTGARNVRQLVNVHPPAFRLRVGDFRAVFRLAEVGGAPAVVVEWVGNRRDAY